jgi:hypothetical protein
MANNETIYHANLPKLLDNGTNDDGTNNNYGKWKTKLYHKFLEWDLLKYIEGPTSDPPNIPPFARLSPIMVLMTMATYPPSMSFKLAMLLNINKPLQMHNLR